MNLKCHDKDCFGKTEVLYKLKKDDGNFCNKVFNSILKKKDKKSNYYEKRKYFEKYYFFLRDNDVLYRVNHRYVKQYKYYEKEMVEVKKTGVNNLFYQEYDEKKEKIINKPFIKRYLIDEDRKDYLNIDFMPDGDEKGTYNLFKGFNYMTILNEDDEITKEDRCNFEFLKDFIKKNICENNKKTYHFFISHLALILQKPEFLNHIIMLFYSSEEGTGKSSFLQF